MEWKKPRCRLEVLAWPTGANFPLRIIERPPLWTPEDAAEVTSLADIEEIKAVVVLRIGPVGTTAAIWSETARLCRHFVQIHAFQSQRRKHLKQFDLENTFRNSVLVSFPVWGKFGRYYPKKPDCERCYIAQSTAYFTEFLQEVSQLLFFVLFCFGFLLLLLLLFSFYIGNPLRAQKQNWPK